MARRNSHTPEQLKNRIFGAATALIDMGGREMLTARLLAEGIGYSPGTIYNFYPDLDALVSDINLATLQKLEDTCVKAAGAHPPGFEKARALAHAYIAFAHKNTHAWQTVFNGSHKGAPDKLPKAYREKILALFDIIQSVLNESYRLKPDEAHAAARLLWASLHGITMLSLDGRLALVGAQDANSIADDLLKNYFGGRKKTSPRVRGT